MCYTAWWRGRCTRRIRAATGLRVFVYVASDTTDGLAAATEVIGSSHVLSTTGSAVHSTRQAAQGESAAAIKVAVDFLALAVADVVFGLGDSSFLGNAAAAGMAAVARVGERSLSGDVCVKQLEASELEALKTGMKAPSNAGVLQKTPHVEL